MNRWRAIVASLVFVSASTVIPVGLAAVSASTGTLSGTVTVIAGGPVGGASISVLLPGTATTVAQTTSDPNGSYSLAVVDGTYDILAAAQNTGDTSRYLPSVVVNGATSLDITLLTPTTTVSGNVFGPDGALATSGSVAMCGSPGTSIVPTSPSYSMAVTPIGSCSADVRAVAVTNPGPGVTQTTTTTVNYTVDVIASQAWDFAFPTGKAVTIDVTNADGSPADVTEIDSQAGQPFRYGPYVFASGPNGTVMSYSTSTAGSRTAVHRLLGRGGISAVLSNGAVASAAYDTATIGDHITLIAPPPPPPPATISGDVVGPGGLLATSGSISLGCDSASGQGQFNGSSPSYSFAVTASMCSAQVDAAFTQAVGGGSQTTSFSLSVGGIDAAASSHWDIELPISASVTIEVVNADGSPADVVSIRSTATQPFRYGSSPLPNGANATINRFQTVTYGRSGAVHPVTSGPGSVSVVLADGNTLNAPWTPNVPGQPIVLVAPSATFVLSGAVFGPGGQPPSGGIVHAACGEVLANAPIVATVPNYSATVGQGSCSLTIDGHTTTPVGSGVQTTTWNSSVYGVDTSQPSTFDVHTPTTGSVTLSVFDAHGAPVTVGALNTYFPVPQRLPTRTAPNGTLVSYQYFATSTTNATTATHPIIASSGNISVVIDGVQVASGGFNLAVSDQVTIILSQPPVFLSGSPTTNNDGDNVADLIESLAPNGGDGNADGTPDAQQANVTSLPSSAGDYVTLAAPASTTLANVRVVDPASYSPPAQLTLPEGLTDFKLDNTPVGQDVILTIYTASTAGVTGYAKYQHGTWSVLPANRVAIFSDRVEIRLTDGGIGDDDGVANGTVVDPGGLVIQSAPLDTTGPTITTVVTPAANAAGWRKSAVTVTPTCSDPSGVGTCPPAHTLGTEGADQSVTFVATDTLGNSTTVTVADIDIDLTAPVITATAPTSVVSTGTVTITCTATDPLSGIAVQDCTNRTIPASQLNLGANTLTFTATDTAGNTTTVTRTVTVTAPANTAPVVLADMGVTGLQDIGFQTGIVALTGTFTDTQNNGPFTASVRWQAGAAFTPLILTNNGKFVAAWIYTGTTVRTATVKICDAAGACGTDDITIHPSVATKITPIAQCVTDRGATANPRFAATWAYTNPAAFPIAVPALGGIENSFTTAPTYRGQPEIFLPGRVNNAFTTTFTSGTLAWKVNGTTATAKSNTTRC